MRLFGFLGGLSFLAACAMPLPAETTPQQPAGAAWDVASEAQVAWPDLVSRLGEADVIIIGELHDNAAHHLTQAWLVGQIKPAGIAFEMIPEASEEGVAVFLENGGVPGEIGPAIGWERIGWPDWDIYRPIFEAWTPEVYTGGAPGRATARKAIRQGAAKVMEDSRFVPVLQTALDAETQSAMEDEMVASHCGHLPKSAAPGMVEAQRLRDAALARATVAALAHARAVSETPRVVVIAGNGHVRDDWGVPAMLRTYFADVENPPNIVTLGQFEGETQDDAPFFTVETAPAPEREDPCLAFAK
jgi:uncharacterized iron-regulated protein